MCACVCVRVSRGRDQEFTYPVHEMYTQQACKMRNKLKSVCINVCKGTTALCTLKGVRIVVELGSATCQQDPPPASWRIRL